MKIFSKVIPAIFAFVISSSVMAAELPEVIGSDTTSGLNSLGRVSVSGINGSPDDAIEALRKKSGAIGGGKLRVIALSTPADSSLWTGNAEVYR
ncbi:YdgH/BhsA/McbA-like domain containing protein [Kluyvera cryocrescens]|uniref:YdgH/BhsA/McbA-like domain containing protein n=1 Tax=Kluyvera cryocrescens TaxID=580 RepID=UPI0028B02219|nr:YdgH/BhsA/McbA-like domain containing protein [Kluyvera cryocrescens]MEB7556991.1 DUF1471 domain-containing protein [Kluyvera cryocrescens]